MGTKRKMTRLAFARRLQDLALAIATGKPVRVGGVLVQVPEQFEVEEELETVKGQTELELELKWPAPQEGRLTARSSGRAAARARRAPRSRGS